MGNFGYGQQSPYDTATEFDTIAFICRQMMARMSTMKLVKVVKVDAGAGTVDVLPLVNQIDGNNNATPHGTVFGLPFFRLQGGVSAIVCPPKADDVGFVVCADRDISNVKANKKQSNPGSFRQFDLADGIYVGGVLNADPTQHITFADDGITIVSEHGVTATVGDAQVKLTTTSTAVKFGANAEVDLTASSVVLKFGGVNITIDVSGIHLNGAVILNGVASGIAGAIDFGTSSITTTGPINGGAITGASVTGGGKDLATHIHGGVTSGGSNSGPPV